MNCIETFSDVERELGISFYVTPPIRIEGYIKSRPEDFVVQEILKGNIVLPVQRPVNNFKIPLSDDGSYVRAVLVKKNIDTFSAITFLSKLLRLSLENFVFLGLKDANALTSQLISIRYSGKLPNIWTRKVKIIIHASSSIPLSRCELWGNMFTIHVRMKFPCEEFMEIFSNLMERLLEGIPAYYGHQRFGVEKPYTFMVGRAVVKRDFDEAVKLILSSRTGKRLLSGDLSSSLKFTVYEKNIIDAIYAGKNSLDSFRRIPLFLQRFFIHSYQSYLFNCMISERIRCNLPLSNPLKGDLIGLSQNGSIPFNNVFRVSDFNEEKIRFFLKKGLLSIVYPIPGYGLTISPKYSALEPVSSILERERVQLKDFYFRDFPDLNSKGYYRPLMFKPYDFRLLNSDSKNRMVLKFSFKLKRGFYASILLRELIKPRNLFISGF
ncbi:MAG: tRNA pseudouridine(13) synthase TruD [archaeon GB-1867-097]|nr:tRNA pseudouridine(13) synthase TruD [Candidatus Culexmicrobium thermophilum]